jgi:uncharacterized protein (TIGR02145 family)
MKPIGLLIVAIIFAWGCQRNHPPVISGISCLPEGRSAGTRFILKVTASDENGDALQYNWIASGGRFQDSANLAQVTWISPVDGAGQTFVLTVTVSDGEAEISMDYPIQLTEPVFGMISGIVYYYGCEVPVGDVTVSVDDRWVETDQTGYFHLDSILAGTQTIKARKDGFGPIDRSVKIIQNVDIKVDMGMTTVTWASKVYGIVKSLDSLPVEGASVIMLNPDRSESDIKATSDSKGYYMLRYVPFGKRKIQVWKKSTTDYGYEPLTLDLNISGQEYPLDIEMEKYPLSGNFTDIRDGHVYAYRIIGSQTWMAENLAYLPQVNPPSEGNETGRFFYVYNYDSRDVGEAKSIENYAIYGVLYSWNAAMANCPPGWHLPTDREWDLLGVYLGTDEGYAMKSNSLWTNHGNGDNSSGFNALPAGVRSINGYFTNLGSGTEFWSSTMTSIYVWCRGLVADDRSLWRGGYNRGTGISVRCIKN